MQTLLPIYDVVSRGGVELKKILRRSARVDRAVVQVESHLLGEHFYVCVGSVLPQCAEVSREDYNRARALLRLLDLVHSECVDVEYVGLAGYTEYVRLHHRLYVLSSPEVLVHLARAVLP